MKLRAANTIASAFEQFKGRLEITDLQQSTVSTRQQNVREAVEKELEVLTSFLIGGYPRHTLIAPLSEADIDIFMVLDAGYFVSDEQANLLDRVKRVLQRTYKTPKISRNGQAVTITFNDFLVDVVPAFTRKGGGYLIANSISETWVSTDPTVHINAIAKGNAAHDGDLVPLIKMIRAWNRNIGHAFVSFYLELITNEILTGVTISDFPSGLRYFFDKGRERIKTKVSDPAGFGGYINPLDEVSTVAEAVSRFETAYSRAAKAESYAKNGYTSLAIDEWRKVFGDYFPAYG
jgi:hypothetical protein